MSKKILPDKRLSIRLTWAYCVAFTAVLVDDPTVVEEYFTEASRSDLLSSASRRHRRVTVVVCQTGDQLKFYQLMPGTDMSSPISSSQR